ncbi:MAG: TrpB-like pyridoxal phosphate-dependent enzyme [Bacillota bacterium]
MKATKITLEEREIPRKWYNIVADMPTKPGPPLNPATLQPVKPEDLSAIFPMTLIEQEVSQERWIQMPEKVLEILTMWRPSPLYRAHRLEEELGTPCHIYYKYEGVSPAGSHKLNTSVPQAYYNKEAGVKRLTTETGAGQWGTALALACNFVGLDCTVYMVRVSYEQKPYRKSQMAIYGAEVIPSPSPRTAAGRKILAEAPDSLGSLGIAISEAVEDAATHDDANYSLGSVLNHVLLHQTVIGLEAKEQFKKVDDYPDIVIGCFGGGSNFSGLALPFVMDKIFGRDIRIIAAEPTACPTLTRGIYNYDFGDTAGLTPLVPMYTLGHDFVPAGIHAGGLRYHGAAPIASQLLRDGLIEAQAFSQVGVFEAACRFARAEGIVPAPESAHAIKCVLDEVQKCKEAGISKTMVFNLSGHGLLDLGAYDAFFAGKLEDYQLPRDVLERNLARLPKVPA